jgi:hypothetical protein
MDTQHEIATPEVKGLPRAPNRLSYTRLQHALYAAGAQHIRTLRVYPAPQTGFRIHAYSMHCTQQAHSTYAH